MLLQIHVRRETDVAEFAGSMPDELAAAWKIFATASTAAWTGNHGRAVRNYDATSGATSAAVAAAAKSRIIQINAAASTATS